MSASRRSVEFVPRGVSAANGDVLEDGRATPSSAGVIDSPHEVLAEEESSALRLWVVLARAHAAISAHATEDASRHGLTLAEFGILEALFHRGPMLLGEVQRRILVSSGGITFLVDRLTAKGLVERRSCPSDRRARYAALTPQGETLVAELFPVHAALLSRVMSGLTPAEQEQAADLIRTLGLHAASEPRVGSVPTESGRG
jgi:MarR family transcriptional regulator, 2-MHQ and catechol-resistance regulon repressor